MPLRLSPRIAVTLAVASSACSYSTASVSQERIGAASIIRNQVVGVVAGRSAPIGVGDNVFRNEAVQTGSGSLAKIVFLDQTNLDTSKNCAPERVWGRSGCVAASGGAFVCSGATVSG